VSNDVLGDYRIEGRIGAGGMGEVFRAIHQRTGRPAALKKIHDRAVSSPQTRERFHREIDALSRLDHPNIIKILDFSLEPPSPFYVVEFYPGGTLFDRLASDGNVRKPRTIRESISIGVALLDGLAYLHDKGYLHRDIKPANVFFDDYGRPVLGDFGLVLGEHDPRLTQAKQVVGTPRYLPPEVVFSQEVDRRSDLYQVGLILYEMIGGQAAFDEASRRGAGAWKLTLPPLTQFNSECFPALAVAIGRSVSVDPADRPSDAIEMAEEIRVAKSHLATRAGVVSFSSHSNKLSFARALPRWWIRRGFVLAVSLFASCAMFWAVTRLHRPGISIETQVGIDFIDLKLGPEAKPPLTFFLSEPGGATRVRTFTDSSIEIDGLRPSSTYEVKIVDSDGVASSVQSFTTLSEVGRVEGVVFIFDADGCHVRVRTDSPMAVVQSGMQAERSPSLLTNLPVQVHRDLDRLDVAFETLFPDGERGQKIGLTLHHPLSTAPINGVSPPEAPRVVLILNALFDHVSGQNIAAELSISEIDRLVESGIRNVVIYTDPRVEDPLLDRLCQEFTRRGVSVGLILMIRHQPENLPACLKGVLHRVALCGTRYPELYVGNQLDSIGWLESESEFASWGAELEGAVTRAGYQASLIIGGLFSPDTAGLRSYLEKGAGSFVDGISFARTSYVGRDNPVDLDLLLERYRDVPRSLALGSCSVRAEARVGEKVYDVSTSTSLGLLSNFVPDSPTGRATLQAWQAPFSYSIPSRSDHLSEEDRLGPQVAVTLQLAARGVKTVLWANPHLVQPAEGPAPPGKPRLLMQRLSPHSFKLILDLMGREARALGPRTSVLDLVPVTLDAQVRGLSYDGENGRRLVLWTEHDSRIVAVRVRFPTSIRSLVQGAKSGFQVPVLFPENGEIRVTVSRNPILLETCGSHS